MDKGFFFSLTFVTFPPILVKDAKKLQVLQGLSNNKINTALQKLALCVLIAEVIELTLLFTKQ